MKPPVIAIGGPTAAGKTDLAKKLYEMYDSTVISVDSTQIYRGLDIGTGKDLSFPQLMIDIKNPGESYSVAEFSKAALKEINKILRKNQLPILVGGTGYYLDALLYEKSFPDISNPELVKLLTKFPTDSLIKRLIKEDSFSAKRVGKNRRRVIRALEIVETLNRPVPIQSREPRYQTCLIVIDPGPATVDGNILNRLDYRLKNGLIEEVRQLKKTVDNTWLREKAGIEYSYISAYLENKLSYNAMREELFASIHAYARRQRTWWRRYKEAIWVVNQEEGLKEASHFLSHQKRVK